MPFICAQYRPISQIHSYVYLQIEYRLRRIGVYTLCAEKSLQYSRQNFDKFRQSIVILT